MMPAMIFAELVPMAGATNHAVRLAMTTGGDVAIAAIVFGTMSTMLYPLVRGWGRRLEGKSAPLPPQIANIDERLDRIERAVDAMALEVERISEGQRFVTKLLAEKSPTQLPPGHG